MRTGIFGGSFNPPHLGHLIIAESVRDQFLLDRVVWIPGFSPPHKQHLRLEAPRHRLKMTRLATASNPFFEVSEIEMERKGTSYTIDTVKTLHRQHADDALFLIIGGDSLREFMTWRSPEQLAKLTTLLVFKRPEPSIESTEAESLYPDSILFADAPLIEISSYNIRRRIREGKSVRYFLPESVREYIAREKLYRD